MPAHPRRARSLVNVVNGWTVLFGLSFLSWFVLQGSCSTSSSPRDQNWGSNIGRRDAGDAGPDQSTEDAPADAGSDDGDAGTDAADAAGDASDSASDAAADAEDAPAESTPSADAPAETEDTAS